MLRINLSIILLLSTLIGKAQNFKLSGKVTNANLEPIAFVSVQIKEYKTGTTTRENGSYNLNLNKENMTLFIAL